MCATSAATGALSAAEVRGRSREDPMPKGRWPRGVTPSLRSGAAARVPDCDGAGTAERSYPASEVGGAAKRSYPASEVRGSSWEELHQNLEIVEMEIVKMFIQDINLKMAIGS